MLNKSTNNSFINSAYGILYYQQYGGGDKILLIFHGFGQDHTMATPIAEMLKEQYTIYSFDLPYHGKSIWNKDEVSLTKNSLQEIFSSWLKEQKIKTFSVIGYSMGGKFALAISEQFPQQVQQLILIAPDGLYKSFWYRLVTSFPIKSLFKHIIYHPSFFFGLTRLISKLGIIPAKLIQFSTSQMATPELRQQVYYTWINFQNLYTNKSGLKTLVNKNIEIRLFLGKNDQLISPKIILPFVSNIDNISTEILPTGHGNLVQASTPIIGKYL